MSVYPLITYCIHTDCQLSVVCTTTTTTSTPLATCPTVTTAAHPSLSLSEYEEVKED